MDDLVKIGGVKFKLVFLGDQGVGKSALASRLIYDDFDSRYQSTIGIDFLTKTIQIDDHDSVMLQVWDTAGQERFRSLIPSYIRDSDALLVVFDITNTRSFESLHKWIRMARGEQGIGQTEPLIVVLGNKVDQDEIRKISFDDASMEVNRLGLTYVETSARTGLNVKEMFGKIARDLYEKERYRRKKMAQELKPQEEKKKATKFTIKPGEKQNVNSCAC